MVSKAEGNLVVPVWSDDGEVKPIIDDSGVIPTEEQSPITSLESRLYGWTGTEWGKIARLFGYSERIGENLSGTKSGDGTYEQDSAAIAENKVYTIQTISISNNTGARGVARIFLILGETPIPIACTLTPAQYEPTVFVGPITLKQGDQVRIQQFSCINGDDIRGVMWGFRTNLD